MALPDSGRGDDEGEFYASKHKIYCLRTLQILPDMCERYDSTKVIFAFFAISTLDLLNALQSLDEQRENIIDWIYYLQVPPDQKDSKQVEFGFRGSMSCTVFPPLISENSCKDYFDKPNLAMTYAALSTLLILGDDFSRIHRKDIINSLKYHQCPNGSFRGMYDEGESDMRFVYCACCISCILNDWSGFNVDLTVDYILKSITYEGAFAQGPDLEAHGGSTFCAIASLSLMGHLDILSEKQLKKLKRWCLFRLQDAFQGRCNKAPDTCYSFWIGSSLKILNSFQYLDPTSLRRTIMNSQDPEIGGIAQLENSFPDPLHTYMSISGLSIINRDDILPIHPALNISYRAFTFMQSLHKRWSNEML